MVYSAPYSILVRALILSLTHDSPRYTGLITRCYEVTIRWSTQGTRLKLWYDSARESTQDSSRYSSLPLRIHSVRGGGIFNLPPSTHTHTHTYIFTRLHRHQKMYTIRQQILFNNNTQKLLVTWKSRFSSHSLTPSYTCYLFFLHELERFVFFFLLFFFFQYHLSIPLTHLLALTLYSLVLLVSEPLIFININQYYRHIHYNYF